MCTSSMASSFTKSAQSFVKYVSLGQAPAGVGAFVPLGALMRWSTLTSARIESIEQPHVRAGARHSLVAAGVIGIRARHDDVADRLRAQLADGCDEPVSYGSRLGVDDDDGLGAYLNGRVAARSGDHVDVALNGQHLE